MDPQNQQPQPEQPDTPQPLPVSSAPTQPISEQWQSAPEYRASQAAVAATPAQPTSTPTLDKVITVFTILVAISILAIALAFFTPLIDIGGGVLMSIGFLVFIPSVFGTLISRLIRATKKKKQSGFLIAAIAILSVLVFNPFTALIILFMIACGFGSCRGS